jgi:hypothetical protein
VQHLLCVLQELFGRHGDIGRLVLPPTRVLALVEYLEASAARSAFRALAYRRLQHVPLYLEWAPAGIFAGPAAGSANASARVRRHSQASQHHGMCAAYQQRLLQQACCECKHCVFAACPSQRKTHHSGMCCR